MKKVYKKGDLWVPWIMHKTHWCDIKSCNAGARRKTMKEGGIRLDIGVSSIG